MESIAQRVSMSFEISCGQLVAGASGAGIAVTPLGYLRIVETHHGVTPAPLQATLASAHMSWARRGRFALVKWDLLET